MTIQVANYSVGQISRCYSSPACVIESPELCREVAGTLQPLCAERGINYVFKASFDKRTALRFHSHGGSG
jgi:2-dehydro-3-deoxyphosphooctonate aldolase (KDO 8-P synthase)